MKIHFGMPALPHYAHGSNAHQIKGLLLTHYCIYIVHTYTVHIKHNIYICCGHFIKHINPHPINSGNALHPWCGIFIPILIDIASLLLSQFGRIPLPLHHSTTPCTHTSDAHSICLQMYIIPLQHIIICCQ